MLNILFHIVFLWSLTPEQLVLVSKRGSEQRMTVSWEFLAHRAHFMALRTTKTMASRSRFQRWVIDNTHGRIAMCVVRSRLKVTYIRIFCSRYWVSMLACSTRIETTHLVSRERDQTTSNVVTAADWELINLNSWDVNSILSTTASATSISPTHPCPTLAFNSLSTTSATVQSSPGHPFWILYIQNKINS